LLSVLLDIMISSPNRNYAIKSMGKPLQGICSQTARMGVVVASYQRTVQVLFTTANDNSLKRNLEFVKTHE